MAMLGVALISGYVGGIAVVVSVRAQDPYFKVGCQLQDQDIAKCDPATFFRVARIDGPMYRMEPLGGRAPFSLKKCAVNPETGKTEGNWPFNVGDRVKQLIYAEDYEHQCDYLGKHWGWYAVRDDQQRTDSEIQEQKELANVRR